MNEAQLFPVLLSMKVALLALAIVAPAGLALAYVQARRDYPFKSVVDGLVLLPMVLPPSVVGFVLVVLLGRRGSLGPLLEEAFGVRLVFTQAAAVVAACVVSLPMLVKTVQPSLEAVPRELEAVGSTLGLSALGLFFRVTLPVAWKGVVAGLVLAFARAVGEFGATLMFAGNIPGRTNTMPLEIFAAYQAGDDARALLYVVILTAASSAIAVAAARMTARTVGP